MWIKCPSKLTGFGRDHPKARAWLRIFKKIAKVARWQSIADVRKTYKTADSAVVASGGTVTIFDVGEHYRLIVSIHYNHGHVFVLSFLTHAEYNGEKWKKKF